MSCAKNADDYDWRYAAIQIIIRHSILRIIEIRTVVRVAETIRTTV